MKPSPDPSSPSLWWPYMARKASMPILSIITLADTLMDSMLIFGWNIMFLSHAGVKKQGNWLKTDPCGSQKKHIETIIFRA